MRWPRPTVSMRVDRAHADVQHVLDRRALERIERRRRSAAPGGVASSGPRPSSGRPARRPRGPACRRRPAGAWCCACAGAAPGRRVARARIDARAGHQAVDFAVRHQEQAVAGEADHFRFAWLAERRGGSSTRQSLPTGRRRPTASITRPTTRVSRPRRACIGRQAPTSARAWRRVCLPGGCGGGCASPQSSASPCTATCAGKRGCTRCQRVSRLASISPLAVLTRQPPRAIAVVGRRASRRLQFVAEAARAPAPRRRDAAAGAAAPLQRRVRRASSVAAPAAASSSGLTASAVPQHGGPGPAPAPARRRPARARRCAARPAGSAPGPQLRGMRAASPRGRPPGLPARPSAWPCGAAFGGAGLAARASRRRSSSASSDRRTGARRRQHGRRRWRRRRRGQRLLPSRRPANEAISQRCVGGQRGGGGRRGRARGSG